MNLAPPLLAFAAMLTTACVEFTARPLSAGATATAFSGRSLDDPGLRYFLSAQRAGSSWNPDKLALAAAYFNGDVAVARAEAGEAAAAITTAGQRPNPVLSFSPGYNTSSTGVSPWIISPSLDVPLETAGKRDKRLLQAHAAAESARLMVAAAAWQARSNVRTAMLELHAGDQTAIVLKEEIALHQDALAKLDAQVRAGEAAAFELTQARLSLNRAELALHDAERQRQTGQARLASAVGVPVAALGPVTLDFSDFESLPPAPDAAARRIALIHRSDLLAALANYKVAEAALRLEVANQYPDLHLGPGYEFDQSDNKWMLGFSVELPVSHQNQGPIRQAEAARVTAAAKFEAKQAAVTGEIDAALAAYRHARAKLATASHLAVDAAHANETTRRMVAAGELGAPDLVRSRIEGSAAALARLEALIQAQEARGLLESALQLPLRPER